MVIPTTWRAAKPEPMMVMGSLTVQTEQETVIVADGALAAFPAESASVMVTSRTRRTVTLFIIETMPGSRLNFHGPRGSKTDKVKASFLDGPFVLDRSPP